MRFKTVLITSTLLFLVMIGSCTGIKSSVEETPSPGPVPTPVPTPVPAPSPTVSVRSNQTISSHPHNIDYYIPSNAESTIVFLHGGGGKKERFANNLGIKNDTTTTDYTVSSAGEAWLIANKVMAVFPQGQSIAGAPLAFTWNNYVMDSGENDVSFLQDLVNSIQNDSTLPATTKFYLVGHSNGGMMTNRMWCESPNTFDAYGALAGPPSTQLSASDIHPCSPSSVKPYIGVVGDSDTGLQTTGNMAAATWTLSSYNGSSPAWVNSTVMNDKLYHADRVAARCSGTVGSPTVSGQLTTYSDCTDSIKFIVVSQILVSGNPSGGDHCLDITSGSGCVTTLAGDSGMDYKTLLFDFLKNF